MDNNLVVSPIIEELKEEVEKLRVELSMILLEHDELKYVICKEIETAYMILLGALEYEVFDCENRLARLKRKLAILQAKKNRQEKIDEEELKKIEFALDLEFEEFMKQLKDLWSKIDKAIDRTKLDVLSKEEAKEIKKLYRSIVKKLHPDMNPNLSDEQIKLFHKAVEAYENGDIKTLRMINDMCYDFDLSGEDALNKLLEEKERLKDLINTVLIRIEEIKQDFPYVVKDIIEDEEKLEKRRNELKEVIIRYQKYIMYYEEKIRNIME